MKVINQKEKKHVIFPASVLEPVRNFLAGELERLKKRRDEVKKDDPFLDEDRALDNSASDLDADEEVGHVRSVAVSRQLTKKIIQIKKALAMVKIGHYGICEKCHRFIDTDRLTVYPETTICVSCTEKKTKG